MKLPAIAILCLGACAAVADDWPQWAGPRRDGIWRETGIVERFNSAELKPRWRTPIGGGYAGPAVAGGRVYVLDRQEQVGIERVLCLDEPTGRVVWKHEYPCSYRDLEYTCGPRCTPTVADGKVYAAGAVGHLFCLRTEDGTVLWSKDYARDYKARIPRWGIASAPLVDGRQLICFVGGAEGAAVVSFDKDTGRELWRAMQLDDIGYCPPTIIEVGGRRQLIFFHPTGVAGLDPSNGRKLWEVAYHTTFGVTIARPVADADRLFVSQYWTGPLMLKLSVDPPDAQILWRNPPEANAHETSINSLMCTPIIRDGHIYGVSGYGALRCIRADDGERVWETYKPMPRGNHANAFLVPNGDRFFIATELGELIIAKLTPKGYDEISRAKLIEPTNQEGRRKIVWSHPAFANQCVYARNDKEILCVDLSAR